MATLLPPEIGQDKTFAEKYAIERELGVGASGIVVGARHRELDERVAIKFLDPSRSQNSELVTRFRREARAAARITSQHVVRIRDIATTESGIWYIVMEYLEGIDLERMLQQSPNGQVPVGDATDFVLQACEALAECHVQQIVHRDLKPSNLFFSHGPDGLPLIKVLDFGISKLSTGTIETNMTDQRQILGSPRYMSPEQFDSPGDVDHRADIWSIGVILYELITGVAPFVGDHVLKLWNSIKTDSPLALDRLRPDAPASLSPVVLKCLEKDLTRRYSNVAELAKALAPFAPTHARASVARIVRTIDGTRPSDPAPSGSTVASDSPNASSVLPSRRAQLRTGVLVTMILVGIIGLAMFGRLGLKKISAEPSTRREAAADHGPSDLRLAAPSPLLPLPATADSAALDFAKITASSASGSSSSTADKAGPVSSPDRGHRNPKPFAKPVSASSTEAPVSKPSSSVPADSSASKPAPWPMDIVEHRKGSN